jgi:cytidylate kinase
MGSLVIAIDGPGGSGKSTLARELADRLGLERLDTGAMYRALGLAALRSGMDPGDGSGVTALAERIHIGVDGPLVLLDGEDVSAAIRTPEVTRAASAVAAHPGARRVLAARQRQWVQSHGGGVVEGRDIGTVVCPDADLKVYLTADPAERARRRSAELADAEAAAAAAQELARRDRDDSTRATSPLDVAPGAVVIDTTGRSIDGVVDEVLSLLEGR